MTLRMFSAKALIWLLPLLHCIQLASVVAAATDSYSYDRCGKNNSLADKVHRGIPNPKSLGNLTSCSLSNNTYSVDYSIAASVLIVIGFAFCFFGSRFFKIVLFFVGFIIVGGLCFFLLFNHLPCETPQFSWVVIGVALGTGLLAGLVTICFYYVGIFAIGAAAGVLLVLSVLSVLHSTYIETHQWLPIVLVAVVAIIFGIVALKMEERLVAIPCTCLIGAILFTYGLDYFVENAAAVQYTWLLLEGKAPHLKCVQTWIMLTTCSPLLLIAGFIVQCCTSKKDKDEDEEEGSVKGKRYRRRGSKDERAHMMKHMS